MSEPENFLSRWSRRKRDSAEAPAETASDERDPACRRHGLQERFSQPDRGERRTRRCPIS